MKESEFCKVEVCVGGNKNTTLAVLFKVLFFSYSQCAG